MNDKCYKFKDDSPKLNHFYFKNENHYIRYCKLILREKNINDNIISRQDFGYLIWSLRHEDIFKHVGLYAPYSVFTKIIKEDNPLSEIKKFIKNILPELRDLYHNEKSIVECKNLSKLESGSRNGYSQQQDSLSTEAVDFRETHSNSCGVYKIYSSERELKYIGKSYHLGARVFISARERRGSYFSFCVTKTRADADLLETYLILTERPPLNGDGTTLDKLTLTLEHDYEFSDLVIIYENFKSIAHKIIN